MNKSKYTYQTLTSEADLLMEEIKEKLNKASQKNSLAHGMFYVGCLLTGFADKIRIYNQTLALILGAFILLYNLFFIYYWCKRDASSKHKCLHTISCLLSYEIFLFKANLQHYAAMSEETRFKFFKRRLESQRSQAGLTKP